jgi:hypothetical protein
MTGDQGQILGVGYWALGIRFEIFKLMKFYNNLCPVIYF